MNFTDGTRVKQQYFADKILILANDFPISITSWGRTPIHNHAVGGVVRSQHVDWLAVDVVCDNVHDIEDVIKEAQSLGLGAFFDKDHIHIQVPIA